MAKPSAPKNPVFLKSLGLQAASQKEESLYVPGFKRTIKQYIPSVPPDIKLHECLDCGDKFVLKSSYDMHVNRHTATIEHVCKICRQANVFLNPCQVLSHARKHTNYSLNVNQENLNHITITPITQLQFKTSCLKFYDNDLDQAMEDFTGVRLTPSSSSSSSSLQQPAINVPDLQQPPQGLLILPNQNGVPNLINPFSNHNFILTDNGLVAVPNVAPNLSPFQIQAPIAPVQEPVNTNPAPPQKVEIKENMNGGSKSLLKTQKKVAEIKTASPARQESSATSTPEPARKPTVKIKDIGSLLKPSVTSNLQQVKTGPSPVVAWATTGDRICMECNNYVKPSLSLKEHYSTLIGMSIPPTCKICQIQLPSKCALSCHMRVHSEQPPFICPDCVLKFPTYGQLFEHMTKVCFHLDKRVRQKCPVENCKAKVFPNVVAYKKHLVTLHTRSIFKCNLCPIACYTEISLNTHMNEKHFGCSETASPYHQCSLCPDRLIPKSRFEQHIEEHVQTAPKMNMYLCKHCNKFNMMRNNHVVHIANCQGQKTVKRPQAEDSISIGGDAKKIKLGEVKAPAPVPTPAPTPTSTPTPAPDKCVIKLNVSKADALRSEASPKVVLTPLLNGVKKTVKTNCFDCKRELSCTFTGEHERQLPIRCPQCYKTTSKQQMNKLPCPALVKIDTKVPNKDKKLVKPESKPVDRKLIEVDVEEVRPKKIVELDVERMSEYTWTVKNKVQSLLKDNGDKQNDVTVIKLEKPNGNKGLSILPSSIKIIPRKSLDKETKPDKTDLTNTVGPPRPDTPSQDIPKPDETKDLADTDDDKMIIDETKQSETEQTSTSPLPLSPDSEDSTSKDFLCAVCQFTTQDRDQFKFHVATHRDVDTAYQCMECGLSFAVKPTLAKHLAMKHLIEDIDNYIACNTDCVDKEAVRAALASVIVGTTVEDVVENQCKICKEKFETAADHDKHFRVHGMAFLKQKEFDKITSES
ncbi:zinc finger protein 532-like [Ctenocephalides felis]|uniref:zinc finger protein 532-like n=1 Tax=Ctenocephalides felis TaxID=7515 RepID=UPI000E6E5030|nr:zinc finger protein 532-like [Ctenocephalides felis]